MSVDFAAIDLVNRINETVSFLGVLSFFARTICTLAGLVKYEELDYNTEITSATGTGFCLDSDNDELDLRLSDSSFVKNPME